MIETSPPPSFSMMLLVIVSFLSIFSFTNTHAHHCSNDFLSEAKNRNLINITFSKRYMESNGVEVAMYLHENTRKLDIMVGAKLKEEEETGWLAWGLNPGPEARMIGTQALIGIKTKNDEKLLKDTYNITSYTKLGCQLLPSPIDLNISNFNFIYVSKLKYHVILATIILPMKYDLSRLNQVWQVGINIGAVGNKELKMHGKGLMNYDSSETINLRTGKGRGNRVHESSKIRQVHGILNIIGWGTVLPIGVIIARNFREFPLHWLGWRKYHISCQTIGYLVGTTGWAVGIWLGKASKYYSFPKHGTYGLFIFAFATIQMLFFKFKPGDRDEFRMYRNMFHHVVGYSLLIVSCINILKGIQIMHLDYTYWKPAYLGIVSCLAFIFLVFEIVSWFKFVCDKFGFWILCAKCIPNEEANEKKGSREDGRVQPSDTPINN
ncbi:cytochrome b561 and DOMON domain-containing protein At3g25290-like [Solanum tuberosum]|uniref:cytochrome b561 and DOMON domain-containing protein At3g25290-like n=1 Tax=Solanum tuberosum TaxID=4113 RepID=UPI00073A1570|nr:PREDICTED: cytochrome b561 and DOMON domain-containing protein At3g25290-like [Solanum tuberosum]